MFCCFVISHIVLQSNLFWREELLATSWGWLQEGGGERGEVGARGNTESRAGFDGLLDVLKISLQG